MSFIKIFLVLNENGMKYIFAVTNCYIYIFIENKQYNSANVAFNSFLNT